MKTEIVVTIKPFVCYEKELTPEQRHMFSLTYALHFMQT